MYIHTHIYIHIHIYAHTHTYIHTYIYIYRERERYVSCAWHYGINLFVMVICIVWVLWYLFEVVSLYVHDVGLSDYMKKVLLGMYVVDYYFLYEVNDACGLFISLLSICEVMVLHMYIALVRLDWNYDFLKYKHFCRVNASFSEGSFHNIQFVI